MQLPASGISEQGSVLRPTGVINSNCFSEGCFCCSQFAAWMFSLPKVSVHLGSPPSYRVGLARDAGPSV